LASFRIAQTAFPLAIVSFLSALTLQVPRYFIEYFCGHHALGLFAAMYAFVTAGNMVAIALGQVLFPRLSKLYALDDLDGFRRLVRRACQIGLTLGIAGTLGSVVLGKWLLGAVYRPEYAQKHWLLTELMVGATLLYCVTLLGYAATAARYFKSQAALMSAVLIAMVIANATCVRLFGLWGGGIGMALGCLVYLVGMLMILQRVLSRSSAAAVRPLSLEEAL
jgi:O-antigen/teichoic acid export membrane protein